MAKKKDTVVPFKRTVDPKGLDPGQGKEIEDMAARKKALSGLEPTPPKFGNPIEQVVKPIAKALTPRTTHTPAEEQTFKLRGQRAFYEGKLERQRMNSTGNLRSPSTKKDKGY